MLLGCRLGCRLKYRLYRLYSGRYIASADEQSNVSVSIRFQHRQIELTQLTLISVLMILSYASKILTVASPAILVPAREIIRASREDSIVATAESLEASGLLWDGLQSIPVIHC